MSSLILNIYYTIKRFLPRRLIIWLRQRDIRRKREAYQAIWPVNPATGHPPEGWQGWPGNKAFCLLLTHDVDTAVGQSRCRRLMDLEEACSFKSAFYVVPERYPLDDALLEEMKSRGFELGVHGLNHDGTLFRRKTIFRKRAQIINRYLSEWEAGGFRAPAMHHNYEWIHDLNITYDASSGDFDPFEPQPLHFGSLWPAHMKNGMNGKPYVEIPYTMPMDFSTFILMGETTIDLWKEKLDFIVESGGVAHIITHPDYMAFDDAMTYDEYPVQLYRQLLEYLKETYEDAFWHVLPHELAAFWNANMHNVIDSSDDTLKR